MSMNVCRNLILSHCYVEYYIFIYGRQNISKELAAIHCCTASCMSMFMLCNKHCELGLLKFTACRNDPRRKLRDKFCPIRKYTSTHFGLGMSNFCLETNINPLDSYSKIHSYCVHTIIINHEL